MYSGSLVERRCEPLSDGLAHGRAAADGRVVVAGEIDGSNAVDVERRIVAATGTAGRLVVDLAGVVYIDSRGLRVLVGLAGRAARAGGRVVVVTPAEGIAGRVLSLARMEELFPVVGSPPGDDRSFDDPGQPLSA